MSRVTISTSTRFEILKRDGFRCIYCGAGPMAGMLDVRLHIDHVEPVAKGGATDPTNLVTACAECNGGKGARRLDDRRFTVGDPEAAKEHAKQIRGYLAAQREIVAAKRDAEAIVLERWQELIGDWPDTLPRYLPRAIKDLGVDGACSAVEVTARKRLNRPIEQVKYFCGVVRGEWKRRGDEPVATAPTNAPVVAESPVNEVWLQADVFWSYFCYRANVLGGVLSESFERCFREIVEDVLAGEYLDLDHSQIFALIDESVQEGWRDSTMDSKFAKAIGDLRDKRRTDVSVDVFFVSSSASSRMDTLSEYVSICMEAWRRFFGYDHTDRREHDEAAGVLQEYFHCDTYLSCYGAIMAIHSASATPSTDTISTLRAALLRAAGLPQDLVERTPMAQWPECAEYIRESFGEGEEVD